MTALAISSRTGSMPSLSATGIWNKEQKKELTRTAA